MNGNLNAGAFWKSGISRQKEASCDPDTYFIYLPRQYLPERGGGDGAEADGPGKRAAGSADRFRRGNAGRDRKRCVSPNEEGAAGGRLCMRAPFRPADHAGGL